MASSIIKDDDVSRRETLLTLRRHYVLNVLTMPMNTQLVDRLQQRPLDPAVMEERQKAVNERINAIYQKAQERLGELVRCTPLHLLNSLSAGLLSDALHFPLFTRLIKTPRSRLLSPLFRFSMPPIRGRGSWKRRSVLS